MFNSRLSFRIDVTHIELIDSPDLASRKREEQVTLEKLKALKPERHVFPIKNPCSVALVFPKSSQAQVQHDFLNTLREYKHLVDVQFYPVNM